MRALHLHHDANSLPGLIGEVLAEREYEAVVHHVCEIPGSPIGSTEFPDPLAFDLVVLYGSRWSVYDDDVAHWVVPELELVRNADSAGVPVLGLCFGGQLLSAAHGGLVAEADRPEVGWHREQAHVPDIEPGPWLQWHFDMFTVPDGAEELAASPSGPQAFRLRRNLGLQFHPEADRQVIESWFEDDIDQIQALEVDPDELLTRADRERPAARARAERLVRTFLG
ncbi:MAG: type 1 glutamine amidotransferase [Microthrixaceae bacterium]